MAERRMMSKKVIDTDAFMDLPISAQCLYMHFIMHADDDGFLANAKRVMRSVGARQADIEALTENGYLISFPSGVVCIVHWNIHNQMRKDRYHESSCSEIKLVTVDENKLYVLVHRCSDSGNQMATDTRQPNGNQMATIENVKEEVNNDGASEGIDSTATKWQPNGNQMATEYSIGKDRLDKNSVVVAATTACARAREVYENNIHSVCSEIEMQKIEDDVGHYGEDVFIKAIERAVLRGNRSLGYIEGILKRWETHGYDDGKAGGRAGAAGQEARDDYVRTNEALLREWAGDDWDSGG